MACITSLPDETLLGIFRFLDLLGAIRNVSRVCKLWKQLAEDPHLYSELDFSCGELGLQLSDTVFKKSVGMCPRVKIINMSRTHITTAGLEIIARTCSNLQSLDLSHCVRLKNAKYDSLLTLPNLKHLNLIGTWKLADPHLKAITPFFSKGINLALTVEIMTSVGLSQTDVDCLFNKLLQLSTLDLHLGHELAKNFLDSATLPLFASSLVSLEIGSRFTTASIGFVPSQIGCLTSLTSLSIISHTLQDLPQEIAHLSSLRSLLISSSKGYSTFTTLPSHITRLANLEYLNLCWNRLTELPSSIVNMTSLKRLNVSNNMLERIPTEIGQMTRLKRLNLSENKITSIPASFCSLAAIERFTISHNNIAHLPGNLFANMKNLFTVDLQDNRLSSLPHSIAQQNLRELVANNNCIESIPSEIGIYLPHLKRLILHENRISSLPMRLEGLKSLKHLSLSNNLIEHVPIDIGNLHNLRVLQLSNNRLQELPNTIMFMRKLRKVELQNNQFASLVSLKGIQGVDSLKSVHFDEYLQEDHSELCMCKFCVFARFDEAHFEEIVEGDADFEEELISLFFNCTETDFCSMTRALAESSFDDIFFISHKIKGALSNMGAVKLSQVCSMLQTQAKNHDLCACLQLFTKLKLEYKHIKRVLVRRLQKCGKNFPYSPFSFAVPQLV